MKINGYKDTIKWYDQNAEKYLHNPLAGAPSDEIEAFVKLLPKGARVLDVGCGPGIDANTLFSHGLQVTGIDLSGEMVRVAKKSFPRITFIQADMLRLPFEKESFAGLWAHAALVHFETMTEVLTALKESTRVLTAGGVIHITVKAKSGDKETAIVTDKLSQHERFFRYFTVEQINQMFPGERWGILQLDKYREIDKNSNGRSEVEWILVLARKRY